MARRRPTTRQRKEPSCNARAIARWPENLPSAVTYQAARCTSSAVKPRAARSSDCEATTCVCGPTMLSSRRAARVQNPQSWSYRNMWPSLPDGSALWQSCWTFELHGERLSNPHGWPCADRGRPAPLFRGTHWLQPGHAGGRGVRRREHVGGTPTRREGRAGAIRGWWR